MVRCIKFDYVFEFVPKLLGLRCAMSNWTRFNLRVPGNYKKKMCCLFQIPLTLPVEILAPHYLETRTTAKATRCENGVKQEKGSYVEEKSN